MPTRANAADSGYATIEAGQWWSVLSIDGPETPQVLNRLQPDAPTTYEPDKGVGTGKLDVITGSYFLDYDYDGMFDVWEDPYSQGSVALVIDGDNDDFPWGTLDIVVQETVTDGEGVFVFTGVPDGTYLLDTGWGSSTGPTLYRSVTISAGTYVILPARGLDFGV